MSETGSRLAFDAGYRDERRVRTGTVTGATTGGPQGGLRPPSPRRKQESRHRLSEGREEAPKT